MRLRPLRIVALLAGLAAPALQAQVPHVRPGSGISPAPAARENRLDVWLDGRTRGEPDGEFVMETRLADVDGRPAIVRRETLSFGGRVVQADSFALDRATLAPLLLRYEGMGGGSAIDFADRRASGWVEAEDGREKVDVRLEGPVFLAGSMDLVLGALPLAAGYTADLALFEPGEGPVTARVEVAGEEEVAAGGRTMRAWRVDVRGSGAAGTYWMREDTRTLVQFVAADRSMRMVRRGAPGERSAAR